jgi:predicted Rossmann fold flavoprotein
LPDSFQNNTSKKNFIYHYIQFLLIKENYSKINPMNKENTYHLIVIGSGAAGMMSAIIAAKNGHRVLLLEKLPALGSKLKATGGGRCNLTNTLDNETFISHFGRNGKFMRDALEIFDYQALKKFFKTLGVESHSPDGFRIFPITHKSDTILKALEKELHHLGVEILCNAPVDTLYHDNHKITGVSVKQKIYHAPHVILATGGLGYPSLGAEGDGYHLVAPLGHKTTPLYPAMIPLITKEKWGANCRADTIPKVTIRINLPKAKKLKATGDLIFTKEGIRGPVVLDFAREITPLLEKYQEVPLLLNLTQGKNEEALRQHLKKVATNHPQDTLDTQLQTLLPKALSLALCQQVAINPEKPYHKLSGIERDNLIKILAWTPLTVIGHDGFKKAMITRGGISLKEIHPKTMQSKIIKGLYFCGEVVDLDGPCGGYNLQWSFASGYVAGMLRD